MNTTPIAFRLFAAATAVAVTLGLLGTVCSIAEPQAGVLMAKTEQHRAESQRLAHAAATLTVAAAAEATLRK